MITNKPKQVKTKTKIRVYCLDRRNLKRTSKGLFRYIEDGSLLKNIKWCERGV